MILPYVTSSLEGIGGVIRAAPDDFIVEEVPLYSPSGEGQHLYVNLTKTGVTTKDVQRGLARSLGKRERDVGFAGMKDKHARATQSFSITVQHASDAELEGRLRTIEAEMPVSINWIDRHHNKLKLGHLLGNRFQIAITDLPNSSDQALKQASEIVACLHQSGLPNFFGPQRFGEGGRNVGRGLAVLKRRQYVKDRWLRRFLISAYQSYLCNLYLARRLESGRFDQLLAGDIAKKYATGGVFTVQELEEDQARFAGREISFTAPIFGSKMRQPEAEAATLEEGILSEAEVSLDDFARAKVDGTRRLGRLLVPDLAVAAGESPAESALIVTFFLPKGAFATTVLREMMKVELQAAAELDES